MTLKASDIETGSRNSLIWRQRQLIVKSTALAGAKGSFIVKFLIFNPRPLYASATDVVSVTNEVLND